MRRPNRWWVVCAVAVILAIPACTKNDLDSNDQDVVLEVTSFNAPAVTGELETGTCQANQGIDCLDSSNCPIGDICILPAIGGECTISEWAKEDWVSRDKGWIVIHEVARIEALAEGLRSNLNYRPTTPNGVLQT